MDEIKVELSLQIKAGGYITSLKEGGAVSRENYAEELAAMTRTLSDKAKNTATDIIQAKIILDNGSIYRVIRA